MTRPKRGVGVPWGASVGRFESHCPYESGGTTLTRPGFLRRQHGKDEAGQKLRQGLIH